MYIVLLHSGSTKELVTHMNDSCMSPGKLSANSAIQKAVVVCCDSYKQMCDCARQNETQPEADTLSQADYQFLCSALYV